jgi:hypothetical protein
MEKVIKEFKVIETNEGFRIEIKGDKEHMKSFMKEFSGHKKKHRWGRRRGGFGWGPCAYLPMMRMHMDPCWEDWAGPTEEGTTEEEETEM